MTFSIFLYALELMAFCIFSVESANKPLWLHRFAAVQESWESWSQWSECSSQTCDQGYRKRQFICRNCFKQAEQTQTCHGLQCSNDSNSQSSAVHLLSNISIDQSQQFELTNQNETSINNSSNVTNEIETNSTIVSPNSQLIFESNFTDLNSINGEFNQSNAVDEGGFILYPEDIDLLLNATNQEAAGNDSIAAVNFAESSTAATTPQGTTLMITTTAVGIGDNSLQSAVPDVESGSGIVPEESSEEMTTPAVALTPSTSGPSPDSNKVDNSAGSEPEPEPEGAPTWGEWSNYAPCTTTCGDGRQIRVRQCKSTSGTGCQGNGQESKNCTNMPCCSTWSAWGQCSITCGTGGTEMRKRMCLQSGFGYQSKTENETRACQQTLPPCCTQWSTWSSCSVTCGPGGVQTRTRTCQTSTNQQQQYQGNTEKENRPCQDSYVTPCPQWATWGSWSDCSKPCAGGTQSRQQQCAPAGAQCPGTAPTQQQPCNNQACAQWQPWANWATCSVTCGGGTQQRTRQCQTDATFCANAGANSQSCQCGEGSTSESQACNPATCPSWATWEPWGSCSKPCGGGTQSRKQQCAPAGAVCPGTAPTEQQNCNSQACAQWQQWANWATCSATCGGGTQQRTRKCQIDDAFCNGVTRNTESCQCAAGNSTESQSCSNNACPTWTQWGTWSTCSVSCGNGQQTRSRRCDPPGTTCPGGYANDTQSCDKGLCPQWSPWTIWSECTELCGGGSRNRSRTCPIPNGCPGLNQDSDICNTIPCPDWGGWAPWADCSATCGGGSRSRSRSCPIPNACKPGEPFEADKTVCNPGPCPSWGTWGPWASCSLTCGGGQQTRNRTCAPVQGCIGNGQEAQSCNTQKCSASTFWSEWSPCTLTCGSGTQTRSRATCPQGPPACAIESQNQPCNPQSCPGWSTWNQWSQCSKSCGSGQRTRNRTCPVVNGCVGQATEIDPVPCNAIAC